MKKLTLKEAQSLGKEKIRDEWTKLCPVYMKMQKRCDKEFVKRNNKLRSQVSKTEYDRLQLETTTRGNNLSILRTAMISLGGRLARNCGIVLVLFDPVQPSPSAEPGL